MDNLDTLRAYFSTHHLDGRPLLTFVPSNFKQRVTINAIIGFSDAIENLGPLTNEQLRYLNALRHAARQLLRDKP
jgi:hypothetical protein